MDYTIETVEKLIYELYHSHNTGGNDNHSQSEANQYLTLAQLSPNAWHFVWTLLSANKPLEVQYFGASTLYIKIAKYFHELDHNKLSSLKSQLLQTLITYLSMDGRRIVETRICVALSAYVIHSISNIWENAIDDLINTLQPNKLNHLPMNRVLQVLVDLLYIIPEEFQTTHFTQNQRIVTRSALLKSCDQIFSLIHAVLSEQQMPDELKLSAIKCFANWSEKTGPLIMTDKHEELVILTMHAICNENLCQTAVEAITSIYSHPEMHKQPNSVLKLIDKMVCLETVLNKAIVEANADVCNNIYTLFIQIAETHSRLLLDTLIDRPEQRDSILKLISIILQCSSTPGYYPIDETCSEQAFNFWYTLQDDIIASDEARIETYLTIFNPLFQSLIDSFLIKVQYPSDDAYENEWNSYDKESFRCYRQDIGDSFMYCYNILRVTMLSNLISHFTLAGTQLKARLNVSHCKSWQYLEAVIYTFGSIAENVDIDELVYLPQIFNALPNIPFAHATSPRLLSTTMDTLAAYAEWIYNHSSFLPNVISLLMIGLKSHQYVTISATMALKDITRECQLVIKPYAEQILAICEESLRPESHLKSKERSRIMCTIGLVLSVLPIDTIMTFINTLITPILTDIHNIINQSQQNEMIDNNTVKCHITSQLSMLAMLFSTLDVNLKRIDLEEGDQLVVKSLTDQSNITDKPLQPIYLILEKVMPLFANVASKWPNDELIAESLCECIKKSLITLLEDVKPLIGDILHLLLFLYSNLPQTTILDLSKQLIVLFGKDSQLEQPLINYYIELCKHTMNVCQQNLRQQTALIEIFYAMSTHILKKASHFYRYHLLDTYTLFRCALSSLILPEKPTVRYCSLFISEFINNSRDNEALFKVINDELENLVGQVFAVIGGTYDSPRCVVEHMADIIMSLNQKYFDNFCRSLNQFVQREGFPTNHINREQKEHFVRLMLKERKNKRKLKEFINELSLMCRGLINTEYGNQLIKLPF